MSKYEYLCYKTLQETESYQKNRQTERSEEKYYKMIGMPHVMSLFSRKLSNEEVLELLSITHVIAERESSSFQWTLAVLRPTSREFKTQSYREGNKPIWIVKIVIVIECWNSIHTFSQA